MFHDKVKVLHNFAFSNCGLHEWGWKWCKSHSWL